uniref:Uncharacterized protein n=1 Tax=Candidatus Kentrum sp. FM TaxID=2126340 RepID=A0A450SMQ0_9GAMM|nr:MAG: hypothetical protein BECKFM1743A_GA0114220_101074 [Candidatus Kentron sp. FM]VFJ54952.1 MAG: hypothetical protein BECKFM1743C_GA0114222_101484 [Candidatus Kentron sp. FM]VFK09922.1 MAG: hypothetical protein BECKFM1743B_GA0114221_101206 [Candidatus Kentron sp. FM]
MKPYRWNSDKDDWLRRERGIGFSDIIDSIESGNLLDDIENPGSNYPHQRMYVVELCGYAVVVPYVECEDEIFLKTAFYSRKAKQKYLSF